MKILDSMDLTLKQIRKEFRGVHNKLRGRKPFQTKLDYFK